jgi:hypothetical protein
MDRVTQIEDPPELSSEDERLLNEAWAAVRKWEAPKVIKSENKSPVRLGWKL